MLLQIFIGYYYRDTDLEKIEMEMLQIVISTSGWVQQ